MNSKTKKYSVRLLSVAMAAFLTAGVVSSLPKSGAGAVTAQSAGRSPGMTDVTGLYSTDEIRRQYLNTDLVSENVLKPDAERWIVVDFGGKSVMDEYIARGSEGTFSEFAATAEAKNISAVLNRKHRNFLTSLKNAGVSYECKYSYTTLTDGVAIKIKNRDFASVQGMNGVSTAYYTEAYATPTAVDNNANAYPSGIYDSSEVAKAPYSVQGEGMVVAILDTGLDHTHPAFQNPIDINTYEGYWTRDEVSKRLSQTAAYDRTGVTVDQVYYNEKVPFAYDYADNDPIVFPSYSTHGTHVAGIIAGEDRTQYVDVEKTQTFIGVAPKAQLMICKVFTDDPDSPMLGGANEVDIIAAISDCATLGVDVINMSLGTSAGFSIPAEKDNINNVYGKLEDAGISLVVAASNDYSSGTGGGYGTNLATNPDSGTVGSPSTYSSALSVASIQGDASRYFLIGETTDETKAQSVVMTESSDANGNAYDFMQQLYDKFEITDGRALTLPYVVIGGVGNQSNYSSASVRRQLAQGNTIALIRRGDITFAEKVEYAMANGAVACIIYNNVSGTIRMSLGDVEDPVPTCSVNMEDGRSLVEAARSNVGYVTFSPGFRAGPFMSEFSSWGPTPDLKLKPEITAHGGEILSTIPGGYNRQSGTSMASPNMAGAVALLRQYVQRQNPSMEPVEVKARTNQLLMSSATMALNEVGNPYSPRKQGAGLAGILEAMDAESYLTVKSIEGKVSIESGALTPDEKRPDFSYTTYDKTGTTEAYGAEKAVESDKVKVEFGDDPGRTGRYDMTFEVHNQKNFTARYTLKSYVMTETLASDLITVAERAHMLDPEVEVWVNGASPSGDVIEVGALQTAKVQVVITLSSRDKDYLESSFKNGMYVEGYIRLEAEGKKGDQNKTTVDLGIPFLAFYGDWTAAPMFDYDVYEIAENEKDTSVEPEDKIKAQAAATQPLGLYWDDGYVIPLGTYLYDLSPFDTDIYPDASKASISAFDNATQRTIYELYNISTGLLRNAKRLRVAITDTATGELIYDNIRSNIGKAYASSSGGQGAMVLMELNPNEWNLPSNSTYRLDLVGELDYALKKGETSPVEMELEDVPEDYKFSFEFTVDTERPMLDSYRVRYEPYTQNNVTKYNVFLDVEVTDNNYIMDGMPCYLRTVKGEKEFNTSTGKLEDAQQLSLFTDYPIPAYSQKGETATLSFEITEYYEQMVNGRGIFAPTEEQIADGYKSVLYFAVEDYAMNQSIYTLDITTAMGFTDSLVTLGEDSRLHLSGTKEGTDPKDGVTKYTYNTYSLTIAQYDNYNVVVNTQPDTSLAGAITIVADEDSTLLRAKDREIFALGSGGTEKVKLILNVAKVEEDETTIYVPKVVAEIEVTVSGTGTKPVAESISLEPVFDYNYGMNTLTGSAPSLRLNPGQEVNFVPKLQPWYCNDLYKDYTFVLTSSSQTVLPVVAGSKDDDGNDLLTVRAETRGESTARITAYNEKGEELVRLSRSVQVSVNEEYDVSSYNLTHFYGDGDNGEVIVPEHYNIMTMSETAFQFNTKIKRVTLPSELTQIPEEAFRGCTSLEYVYIPAKVTFIGEAAFAGCENLTTVVFAKTDNIITGDKEVGIGAVALGRNCFRNCKALKNIENQQRITTAYDYAFSGCESLEKIDISGLRVAGRSVFGIAPGTRVDPETGGNEYGWGMIEASEASGVKTVITGPDTVFGPYMFYGCANLKNVGREVGDSYVLGIPSLSDYAFAGCAQLETVNFDPNTEVYYFGDGLFTETLIKNITLPAGTYSIGAGAFAGCGELTKVTVGANTEIVSFKGLARTIWGLDGESKPVERDEVLYSFAGCGKLNAFAVESDNELYEEANGILYSKGQTALIAVPYGWGDEEIELPSSVKTIGSGAFTGTKIESFTASDVTEIGAYAFADCAELKTVELSDEIKEINEGTFALCTSLTSINLEKVEKIDQYAFFGCGALQGELSLPVATDIYALAFKGAKGITKLSAPELKGVGYGAFMGTSLEGKLELPKVEIVDAYAFYDVDGINGVALGPVTQMGEYAFAYIDGLLTVNTDVDIEEYTRVTFAEGATTVGAYAFWRSYPAFVDLPSTMHLIGMSAFEEPHYTSKESPENGGLITLTIVGGGKDLVIGARAFANCYHMQLGNADALANTSYIGMEAFVREIPYGNIANEALQPEGTTALEISASEIAAGAFANAGLTGLKLTSKTTLVLGADAFQDNSFTTITIPASMSSYTYEDRWDYFSLSGEWKTRTDKYSEAFGGGAFGNNRRLTSINVASGNPVFFSEDGVLYAHVKDGYVLVQYPANKADESYTVKTGTVRIAQGAFHGARNLTEVHIPYTVRSIGAYAFYEARAITDYYFEGVEAPVLESPYVVDDFFFQLEALESLWISGLYYSNFYGYGVGSLFFANGYDAVLHRPENSRGYDDISPVWQLFFWKGGTELTDYAADNNTQNTIAYLRTLMQDYTPAKIRALVNAKTTAEDKKAEILRISKQYVQPARASFNLVTDERQLAFISAEEIASLLSAEQEIRTIKAELGIPAVVTSLIISSYPDKTGYVLGETLDTTGLVIIAEYDDKSRIEVTDYTLSVSGPFEELGRIEIVVSYGGKSVTFFVNVSENTEGDGSGADLVAIIVGSVAGALALAGGIILAVILLKKRKKAKGNDSEGAEEPAQEESAEAGAENSDENKE